VLDQATLPKVKMPNRNGFVRILARFYRSRRSSAGLGGLPESTHGTPSLGRRSERADQRVDCAAFHHRRFGHRRRFELKQGGVVPKHSHANEQVSIVLSGVLLFKIEGKETVVKAGEVMQIPGNAAHEVEVLEDTLAVDVFSPVRQDWIDKTDSYFKR
jgi:mannose-6-phosphate isomerase-like protein (cupin superfamily)